MTDGPHITPDALASFTALVPPRLTKRLDAAPRLAAAWPCSQEGTRWIVATDGEDRVTVTGDLIKSIDQVSCTCLLSPRCLHVLAVLSLRPLADAEADAAQEAPATTASTDGTTAPAAPPTVDERTREVARQIHELATAILWSGLASVSVARLGQLLRAVHDARRQGLPALENALLTVVDDARKLREERPDFDLRTASDDLARLVLVAKGLALGATELGGEPLVGTARRAYTERRGLRLVGLGCEPVLAGGYAGVVSTFTDGAAVFSAGELWPGDEDRALAAATAQLRFGEISIAHRETVSTSLIFALAKVSREGRLGAGQDVTAARAPHEPAARDALFDSPAASQLDKALSYHPLASREDNARLFLRGTFVDVGRPAFRLESGAIRTVWPAIDQARFAFRENLALLAARGIAARGCFRVRVGAAGVRLVPTTIFPWAEGGPTVASPHDLGFARLARADLPVGGGTPTTTAPHPYSHSASNGSPLRALEARVHRWALAGAGSLPTAAHEAIATETRALDRALFPTLAARLTDLARATARDHALAADAFVAALVALRAAELSIARTTLLDEACAG